MSALDPFAGEIFVLRLWKTLITNPSVRWVNTYECRFQDAGTLEDLESLALGLETFEAELALNSTQFLYATASTWLPEGEPPYDPDRFATFPLSMTGQKAFSAGTQMDLRTCLRIRRVVPTGFQGKLELRNCLVETDVIAPAGTNALADPGGMAAAVAAAITAGGINANLAGGLSNPLLAIVSANMATRYITALVPNGVSNIPLNHKYFDRAPAPPP